MSGDRTPADREALPDLLEPSLLDEQGVEREAMRASVRQRLFGGSAPAFHIDRFTVLHRLGAGGMGVVYLAHDPSLGRKVAIKLLHAEGARHATAQARLQREARALASLSHPNVVVVHEVGVHEGQLYLVMEHVAGQTLRHWTRAHATDWRAIVAQYRAAGEGLAAAHRAGIIHRDFKPDNVIVDEDGRPRVLDFGLAAAEAEPCSDGERSWEDVRDDDLTKTGTILGTPSYMAPEQFLGMPVDARTDQFSFCVALWEALFERRPFEGDSLVALRRAVIAGRRRRPPSRARVPRAIVAALERGLSARPAERFDTMSELLLALAEPRPSRPRVWLSVGLASLGGLLLATRIADAVTEPEGRVPGPRERSASAHPPPSPPPLPPSEPVATEPPVTLERPTLGSRRLTHTSGLGVILASMDPLGQHVLYGTSQGELWRLPLTGGQAQPVTLPVSPSVTAHCGPDDSAWLVGDGAIRRVRADGEIEPVVEIPEAWSDLDGFEGWVSPNGMHLGLRDDSGFRVWDLSEPDVAPRRFEMGGVVFGVAWSPSGDRIAAIALSSTAPGPRLEVFDADGGLRSSTPFSSVTDGEPAMGLAWLPSGLVALAFDDTELWVQCLTVTEAGVERGRRSADLGTNTPTRIIGATQQGVLVLRWADEHAQLLVLDSSTTPARMLGSPLDIRRNKGGPVWLSERELAFLAAEPPGALVKVDVEAPGLLEPLAPGPFLWATSDGEGGIVLVSPEGATIHHLASGTTRLRPVPLPEVAVGSPFLRCRSPRDCLWASSDEPITFFGLDLERGHVRRRFACPADHACEKGRFGWSHDGQEVLLVRQAQGRLSRIHAETGRALGEHPPAPPWATIQTVTQTSRGELLLTGMLRGTPPDGEFAQDYRVLRIDDDGTYHSLWGSEQTWMLRPVASPSGQRIAVEGLTLHQDLVALELGSLCDAPP